MSVWRDVRFDAVAADEAAEALAALARSLDEATEARARLLDAARRDWEGRSGVQADVVIREQHRRAGDLVQALRWQVGRILDGADEARAEQTRRRRRREELLEDGADLRLVPS